jgi:hypothetical protein
MSLIFRHEKYLLFARIQHHIMQIIIITVLGGILNAGEFV